MRYQGKITSWNEARGFGFIEWNGGNDNVFVHISSFDEKPRRLVVGDIVAYEVTKAKDGRTRAEKVAFPSALLVERLPSNPPARFPGAVLLPSA